MNMLISALCLILTACSVAVKAPEVVAHPHVIPMVRPPALPKACAVAPVVRDTVYIREIPKPKRVRKSGCRC